MAPQSSVLIRLVLLAAAASLGYVTLTWRSSDLEFAEPASPVGFRELVLPNAPSLSAQVLSVGLPNPERATAARLSAGEICTGLFESPKSPRTAIAKRAVPVVAFFDYRCAYCRTLAKHLSDLQRAGRVWVIYKEWPVLGASSVLAARAALAAAEQGQYQIFHERLMQSRLVPTEASLEQIAKTLDLDVARLREDMDSAVVSDELAQSAVLASNLRLTGTPALVVGRTIVRGAITQKQLERLIEAEARSARDCK